MCVRSGKPFFVLSGFSVFNKDYSIVFSKNLCYFIAVVAFGDCKQLTWTSPSPPPPPPSCVPQSPCLYFNDEFFTSSVHRWRPPLWEYPQTEVLDFSNLLVPTMDSTRALFLLRMLHKQRKAVLMVGAEGTAKTSTALMFFTELDPVKTAVKRCGTFIARDTCPHASVCIALAPAAVCMMEPFEKRG